MDLGIENLKKLIKVGCSFPKQIAESSADGWQFTDALSFLDELVLFIGVAKSWKDIAAEFKDLDITERQEVYDYVKVEFDIPNDKVEFFAENALMWGITTVNLYGEFKAIKKVP